mgnify:CR=1 FL=1
MEINEINKKIIEYFNRQGESVDIEINIFESGIIDSMGIIDLVCYIEEEMEIELNQDFMKKENFESISTISNCLLQLVENSN